MKRYVFNLQKLLDIRNDEENLSKLKFKEAKEFKELVEKKLNKLEEDFKRYSNISKECSTVDRKLIYIYLNGISKNIIITKEELSNKEKILEERRKDLESRKIKSKTVEILKEKDYKTFMRDQNMLEQKENDEYALGGFIRNIERR